MNRNRIAGHLELTNETKESDMCGCLGDQVCGYHFDKIERLYRELLGLEQREQGLSVGEYGRLREVRGALHAEGLRAEIVIHRIKMREWDEANAR